MFWDELVRRWRRESKVLSPRLMRAAGGSVAVLPAPRPQRRRRWPVWLLIVLVLGVGLFVFLADAGILSKLVAWL